MTTRRILIGEFLGTFILIFFGCGSVVAAVILGALPDLPSVAAVWALAVAFGIIVAAPISGAHMNPAVTLAFAVSKHTPWNQVPAYILTQFVAAFAAAGALLLIFDPAIAEYETFQGIVRGSAESYKSAMVFGEYYPNPGFEDTLSVSTGLAFAVEAFGTFVLMVTIYQTAFRQSTNPLSFPLAIGLVIFMLICLIAPLTQACFNPARDMGPRFLSALAGWGSATFPNGFGHVIVYVTGPIIGAVSAAILYKTVLVKSEDPEPEA